MINKKFSVVFLTGCASGLGLHLAECFIEKGYRVVATDINLAGLKSLAREKNWQEEQVLIRKLDVSKSSQWQKLWAEVLAEWGQVDVMLNVAGYLLPGYVAETPMEQIDRHIDINVKGLMYGSKLAAEHMVEAGQGHIINIASLAGLAPIPGIGLYSASKFAVRGFTLALAQELKPHGVCVSVVCPDAIETPMLTLQEDYEEAALTFSGNKTLTVEGVADAIFKEALGKQAIEVTIPSYRGWIAKAGSSLPSMSFALSDILGKLGRKKQEQRKHGHA
jgi:3-oxoacyl-[acyl-carrier protein] reductase